jgi:hypothetical protein
LDLDAKSRRVDQLVAALGFDLSTPDLLDIIQKDADTAWTAAESLYMKKNEFAHILDPRVLPPKDSHACTRPGQK